MTSERWRRIEELYHAAQLRAPGERVAFLAGACLGDDELKREIEALLAGDSNGNVPDSPASKLLTESMLPKSLSAGDKLGITPRGARWSRVTADTRVSLTSDDFGPLCAGGYERSKELATFKRRVFGWMCSALIMYYH